MRSEPLDITIKVTLKRYAPKAMLICEQVAIATLEDGAEIEICRSLNNGAPILYVGNQRYSLPWENLIRSILDYQEIEGIYD